MGPFRVDKGIVVVVVAVVVRMVLVALAVGVATIWVSIWVGRGTLPNGSESAENNASSSRERMGTSRPVPDRADKHGEA